MNRLSLPSSPEGDNSAPPDVPPSRGRWLVVAFAIGLVALPLLWAAVPAEIARWYQAAATEAELDEDYDRALQKASQSIEWNDADPDLYAYRGSLKLATKDLDGALDDCNRAVKLTSDASMYSLYQRALVYQRRDEHELALQDIERIVDLAAEGTAPSSLTGGQAFGLAYDSALNLRAYSRALAQLEIEEGLVDIDEAFERVGTEEISAYLDTRGYLRYLAGEIPGAEQDMERAVALAELGLAQFQKSQERIGDDRIWDRQGKQLKEGLAVLLQHRGLVYQAQQRSEEAAEDFRRAKEFGYSPEDGVW